MDSGRPEWSTKMMKSKLEHDLTAANYWPSDHPQKIDDDCNRGLYVGGRRHVRLCRAPDKRWTTHLFVRLLGSPAIKINQPPNDPRILCRC